jgi:catechol 2,3-dioxygenase-like lactoylglutathione lyase family enzyme
VFDHVTIRVADWNASREFYETVLGSLGQATKRGRLFDEWGDFSIAPASEEHPLTRGLHVAFVARSEAEVDAFWRAGVDAGYDSDGEPGPRPRYHERYYGGFLRDPDGNSAEAVYHGRARVGQTNIDHLWIRVSEPEASKRFYATIAPVVGLTVDEGGGWGVGVAGQDRSLTLVRGEPTANVHIAFPVADDETVREFHRVAVAAGYRDNGPPGERPIYHPGYYGAFVLDPDGNNVEAVNHNR